jgi:hypothetical protein
MFTPVRLGFPRETLDGAKYMGHVIPSGTVSFQPALDMFPGWNSDNQ